VPVAYGLAQILVPSSWWVSYGTALCDPQPPGAVEVGRITNAPTCPPAASRRPMSTATLLPLSTAIHPTGREIRVNGIRVFVAASSPTFTAYEVPALGVEISATGSLATAVLATMTYSPRAVVLADGPVSSVPSTWKWVSFAGVRFATPNTWEQRTTPDYGPGCEPRGTYLPSGITLSTDERLVVLFCPAVGLLPASVPVGGVEVDALASKVLPTPTGPSTHCMHIHGLIACPYSTPASNVLYIRVSGPHLPHPVMFEIGLAANGAVARTLLGSLQAA
jgi:hypothetical protein